MHTNDLVGARCHRPNFGNRNAGCIARQNTMRRCQSIQLPKNIQFDFDVLRSCLNHQIRIAHAIGHLSKRLDSSQATGFLLFSKCAFSHLTVHVFCDSSNCLIKHFLLHINQIHGISALGKNVGNSISHGATTYHCNLFHRKCKVKQSRPFCTKTPHSPSSHPKFSRNQNGYLARTKTLSPRTC